MFKSFIGVNSVVSFRRLIEEHVVRQPEKDNAVAQWVLQSIDEGVFVLDSQGCVLLSNLRARELFGISQETVDEEPLGQLLTDRGISAADIEKLVSPDYSGRFTVSITHADKREIEVSGSVLLSNEGSKVEGRVLIFHDVTAQKLINSDVVDEFYGLI